MNQVVKLHPPARGIGFAQLAIAMALGRDNPDKAAAVAERRWGEGSLAHRIMKAGGPSELLRQKAAVAGGATLSGSWTEALVGMESATTEFFSLVRERSLVGRVPGLRRVPVQTRLVGLIEGFSAAWTGEGQAKPTGRAVFNEEELPSRKVSALAVVSKELLEAAEPTAELLIRDDLAKSLAAVIDSSFISPGNAGTPGLEPASVAFGAPTVASSGDGSQDIREALASFSGDVERAVLIGSPQTFVRLNDPFVLPNLGAKGGSAFGVTAVPSTAAGDNLILLDPDAIAVADGELNIRTSSEAVIEMADNPSQSATTPTPTSQVSLWQADAVAVLTEKVVNWQPIRPCASVVTSVAQS